MNRIERYLGQIVLSHTFIVMLVILLIFAFFEFMDQMGKLNEGYHFGLAILYVLLKLPVYFYESFPVVLLIGTLMGLGSLASHSELTILRVSGWSIRRILWAVVKTVLLMWLFVATLGELVAPASDAYATKIQAEALNKNFTLAGYDLKIKHEDSFIEIDKVIDSQHLQGIQLYRLMEGRLVDLVLAENAYYQAGKQTWRLEEVQITTLQFIEADMPIPTRWDYQNYATQHYLYPLPLQPSEIETLGMKGRYQSAQDLWAYIAFLEANQLNAEEYSLAFWKKTATPVMVLAMVAIVFPLVFGGLRQVNMGQRIFVGVMLGMTFQLSNELIGNLALVYQFSTMLAAFLPSVFLLIIAVTWLSKTQKN